jgi:tRNA-binding EMAP/Myf-like protein
LSVSEEDDTSDGRSSSKMVCSCGEGKEKREGKMDSENGLFELCTDESYTSKR